IPQIVLPIGISFYTFQLLSYIIDVYWKKVPAQPKYWKLLLYSSLFHQCIAGPIVRYETVAHEIDNRKVTVSDVYDGIRRFSIGLAKKAILANGCAALCDSLLVPGSLSGQPVLAYWTGMFAYMLQIYLDFSAYSDMAIGMGRMVGFHYLENFNYPYMADSVQDFWRRWHISLSAFFRDYVYIPLGGNRGGVWIYVRNMIVVWFLTGMWHGASWNYILWGLYYLLFLLLEKFVIRQRIPSGWNRLYTLSVVFFGWTIFKFESLSDLGTVLAGMFGFGASSFGSAGLWTMVLSNLILLTVSVIACTNFSVLLRRFSANLAVRNESFFWAHTAFETILPVFLLLISAAALIGDAYNPFLYFQF
ncbi:MAG: MBOAT family protein, partial [Erysipelotrichaceae bacterium]|nr:MBOAT family protein [Erysipelotrichaceae bacterium]